MSRMTKRAAAPDEPAPGDVEPVGDGGLAGADRVPPDLAGTGMFGVRGDPSLRTLAVGLAALIFLLWLANRSERPGSPASPLIVPLFGLTFAGVALLACWAVFSPASIAWRLAGTVLGLASLEASIDLKTLHEFILLPTLTMAAIVGGLVIARRSPVRLEGPGGTSTSVPPAEHWRPRFAIRDLMILTAGVALLVAGARALQGTSGPPRMAAAGIWALCFAAVSLLALRAGLGRSNPWGRVAAVFALSPLLGGGFAYVMGAHRAGWIYIITIMLLQPAIVLGVLAVARAQGFRLVRDRP